MTSAKEDNAIKIGKNCLFSYNIEIRNTDSHKIYQKGKHINKGKEIVINDNVWICEGVTILKGVEIGKGNIVGIKSIVNKSITKENCIFVGNPIRCVKEEISWER